MASPPDGLDAQRWLDLELSRLELEPAEAAAHALCERIREQGPRFQISVLKACVERLPALRARDRDRGAYTMGSVLYGAVCALYGDRLPYSERDICDLLRTARHDCGHGGDVYAPFDAAVEYARQSGVTEDLAVAVREYTARMKGLSSAKVHHLKRRAGVFLLLDSKLRKGEPRCWSHRFRVGLGAVPAEERLLWQRLILSMSVQDQPSMPKSWRTTSERFLRELGVDRALERFEEWWPDSAQPVWPLQSGGSQLLKHWVWTLDVIESVAPAAVGRCDGLTLRLATLDWKPRERATKVLVAATGRLVKRPPEVAWGALQHLRVWSAAVKRKDWEPDRIADFVARFADQHGLEPRARPVIPDLQQTAAQPSPAGDECPAHPSNGVRRRSTMKAVVELVRRQLARLIG